MRILKNYINYSQLEKLKSSRYIGSFIRKWDVRANDRLVWFYIDLVLWFTYYQLVMSSIGDWRFVKLETKVE